jgi:hypothetical protein
MNELNRFSILKKTENYADIRVTITHLFDSEIHSTRNFALQIILELFDLYREGGITTARNTFPLSHQDAINLINNKHFKELDALFSLMKGEKVPLTAHQFNIMSDSENYTLGNFKFTSIGFKDNFSYGYLEPDYCAFCIEADKKIKRVELLSVSHYPYWTNTIETWLEYGIISHGFEDEVYESQFPKDQEYLLRVFPEDDNLYLLNHLIEQSEWDSNIIDFEKKCSTFKPKSEATHHCLLYETEPSDADDQALLNWWKDLNSNWKLVFNINFYLQSRMNYLQLHEDIKGMMTPDIFRFIFDDGKLNELKVFEPDINALRNIVSMKMLFASNCNLKDLSPLSALKNLKMLELEQNPIENADILQSLTKLEDLTLIVNGKKPNQLGIASLIKMKDLTFDPHNQEELDLLVNMPRLRTFYTELDFEPNLSVFKDLQQLKKIVGYSPTLDNHSRQILSDLKNTGVEIRWVTNTDSI